jgi:hypothetical protein
MTVWTKEHIEKMIADGVEESMNLEYKGAASLGKSTGKITEITKDVSSFANASGGTIIYGVAEFDDADRQHLPERPDPIKRTEFSKEWLDQVIQTIQPRIDGFQVKPVPWDEQANTVCYVVEIPQSDTAHQARDHRYHKRYNFTALVMEDYEIRDVMNRRKHPKIRASIHIHRKLDFGQKGYILVKLENIGKVLAKQYMVHLQVPVDMYGLTFVEGPGIQEDRDDGLYSEFRLAPENPNLPLFPGSDIILRRSIQLASEFKRKDNRPVISVKDIRVKIFADEMPPIEATLDFAPVWNDWVEIPSKEADAA